MATFDQPHASSDSGAVLLKAADHRLGLLTALTATVPDARASARVTHGVSDLIAQRVFAIACGHPDGNDADRLADRVLARHRRRRRGARLITIDLDVTEDETHGAQQLTFFNGFYDPWGYLPLVASRTFDDEARQYLVAAILRPGNAAGTAGAVGLLKRLLPKRWRAFPRARLRVRLDGGFATPEIFDPLEAAGVEYVVAMGNTAVLTRHAEPAGAPLQAVVATTQEPATAYAGGGVSGGHLGGAPTHHDQSRSGVAPRTSAAR